MVLAVGFSGFSTEKTFRSGKFDTEQMMLSKNVPSKNEGEYPRGDNS